VRDTIRLPGHAGRLKSLAEIEAAPCLRVDGHRLDWQARLVRNGQPQFYATCTICQIRSSTIGVNQAARYGKTLHNVPVEDERPSCCLGEGCDECEKDRRCAAFGCREKRNLHEHHHVPRAWVGKERADELGTVTLCPRHHKETHDELNAYVARQIAAACAGLLSPEDIDKVVAEVIANMGDHL